MHPFMGAFLFIVYFVIEFRITFVNFFKWSPCLFYFFWYNNIEDPTEATWVGRILGYSQEFFYIHKRMQNKRKAAYSYAIIAFHLAIFLKFMQAKRSNSDCVTRLRPLYLVNLKPSLYIIHQVIAAFLLHNLLEI